MLYSQEGPKGVTTWPLPTFGEVYARCKPKQKLTSPDADPLVLDHPDGSCKVACRVLLFPRGLSDSDESPTLGGVMFKQAEGDGSCTIHFSCTLVLMDGAEELNEYTDSGECTLDGDGQFSAPTSVEFGHIGSLPSTVSAAVVLKCWLKNDDLFGDVRFGFSSIATSMYGFVSQSPAAARPPNDDDEVKVDAPVKIQASSLDDLVTVVLDTPEGWSEDEWAVLVHICAAVVATRDTDTSASEKATLSDEVKGELFRLCPPLRTHFQELAHAPHLQGLLIKQLVGALQTFSGLQTPPTKVAELHALIEEVGTTNELEEMEMLYRFVLDPSSITAGTSEFKEGMLSELSTFKSDLVDMADRLDESNCTTYVDLIEGKIRALEERRDAALTANATLRDRVRYIVEYAGWGVAAVSGLQACLDVPVVSPIEEAIQTGRSLLVLLSKAMYYPQGGGGPLTRSLTPDPHQGDDASIMEPQHDGLTCTPFKEGILILGGDNMRRVWRFSFRSLEWSCISVQGQFAPPGRLNHSTTLWRNCLLVSGGTTEEPEEHLTVYKLDLTSMRWSRLNTSVGVSSREVGYPHMSTPPLSRTHHVSCTIDDKLYVHGGRPIYDNMSSYDMRVLQGNGFFEVLELDLINNQWYPVCHCSPAEYVPPPPLWGHSIVPLEGKGLALFGGFEVDLSSKCDATSYSSFEVYRQQLVGEEGVENDDTAPGMEMSNTVHILGLRTSKWASFAPSVMDPSPEARALHVTLMVNNTEMLVLGGIGVSASADVDAEVAPLPNAWVWKTDTGVWRQLDPFPIEEGTMQGARLFSSVYQNQLVVSNDITAWNVLDISTPVEVRSADGADSDEYCCAAVGMEDWQLVLSKAPKSTHNPLLQDGLVGLGSILHPRKRRVITDMYDSPLRRGKGPVDPSRADVVRLYDPFRDGNTRPREGQVNPILYALIADK